MRLFLAILLPDAMRHAIAQALSPAREAAPQVRWVPADRLHLTIKFLGERPEAEVPLVIGEVAVALRGADSFDVTVRGTGAFPNFSRPRVVWFGMTPTAHLSRLAARIDTALVPIGIARESRPFRAHVTVGRVDGVLPPDRGKLLEGALRTVQAVWPLTIRAVALVESIISTGGPRYETLHQFPLGES